MQRAFHLELDRCTGCKACEVACEIENDLPEGMRWREVGTFNERGLAGIPRFHLSLACNHCRDAPCEKNCPALAYDKDPVTGAVTIDASRCIGCKYCSWACPYDAPKFDNDQGIMQKCTFCSHRLQEGREPACTTSCPTGALGFGDYGDDREAAAVPGFYRENIQPALFIQPARRGPETGNGHTSFPTAAPAASKVSLRSEWSLLLFTWMAPILVGLVAAGAAPGWFVPLVGGLAMALSASHLGKPARAHRAILNWKRSWLSREVLLFPAFIALAVLPGARVAAMVCGFTALYAIDQVYQLPTNRRRGGLGRIAVLLTGLFLTGVFGRWLWLALLAGLLKLVLYVARRRAGPGLGRGWSLARLCFGFLLPAVGLVHYPLAVAGILAGELIDRAEFYRELDFVQPATQMHLDLAGWSSANAKASG